MKSLSPMPACTHPILLLAGFLTLSTQPTLAQGPGTVLSQQKISDTQGGFTGTLVGDHFAWSVASLGDLDGDGIGDLAVGSPWNPDGGPVRGAVWILFLNADGTVRSYQKISSTDGGFTGVLEDFDEFGSAVTSLGDLDGDGVNDIAVGAWHDEGGPSQSGAVWILFLNADGTVKADQKISDTDGGFSGVLDSTDFFGYSLATLGDMDGDGVADLAVGAIQDDDGGTNRGAVWILFLNADGTVKADQKISNTEGNLTATLANDDFLGSSLAFLGDHDGDGVGDLAVGSSGRAPTNGLGSMLILFLNADGTVKAHQRVDATHGGGMAGLILEGGLASLGDLDGDGIGDLAAGAFIDSDGGIYRGAVWILFLQANGRLKAVQKISGTEGNFTGVLDDEDWFGYSLAALGDLDGDGIGDLAVGALHDDDGGSDHGAVWVLFLDGPFQASATLRNGSGTNATCYTSLTLPVLGTSWDAEVSHAAHPGATATVIYGYLLGATGPSIGAGELLLDLSSGRVFRRSMASAGTADVHSFAIPPDPAFAGLSAATQALILGGGLELCNAVDLVVGF